MPQSKHARLSGHHPESPTVDNSHLDYLAGHPWFDLVDPGDFFLCTNGMMWASAPEEWWGLYYREPDPRIPLGDYVCRAMLRRIEVLSRLLEPLWRGAFETAQHRGPSAHGTASHLFDAKVHLDPAIEVLRRLCHPADARLREACCTLTQIAAAYDPNPDLAWLGHPQWPSEAIARLIRTYIRPREEVFSNEGNGNGIATVVNRQGVPRCLPAMISGVAESLMTVKELYRRPIDPSDLIETLRHERRLLLVDSRPRAIFWDGNKLPADWDDNVALFDLLWKIAVFRKHNKQPIAEQLSGDGKKGSLKHRRLRLKTHLPKDLDSLIQSARPGSYCLHLGPESISTLRLDDDMQPIEVGLEAALDI